MKIEAKVMFPSQTRRQLVVLRKKKRNSKKDKKITEIYIVKPSHDLFLYLWALWHFEKLYLKLNNNNFCDRIRLAPKDTYGTNVLHFIMSCTYYTVFS